MTSTPISNAARLLRECAEEIKSTCTAAGEWCSEATDDKADYEERIAAANLLEAMPSKCLHQIQEPPTKTEALAHYSQQAILAIGEAMAVPDGWKLVPVVPTTEMGWAYLDKAREISPGDKWKFSHPGYEAALSAAPPQPASVSAPAAAAPVVLPEPDAAIKEVLGLVALFATQYMNVSYLMDQPEHEIDPHDVQRAYEMKASTRQYIESKLRALLAGASAPAAQAINLLAADHEGMKVDYRGLFSQVQRAIKRSDPGYAEMLRQLEGHLKELGQRWYAGDTNVVDEILQLYCIERDARKVLPNPPIAAPQAQADARDAIRELIAKHRAELEHNDYAYFELAYTRRTGWMAWITDKPLIGGPVINPDRKVLARGQGDTPEEACAAAIAAQQGGTA